MVGQVFGKLCGCGDIDLRHQHGLVNNVPDTGFGRPVADLLEAGLAGLFAVGAVADDGLHTGGGSGKNVLAADLR